MIERSQKIDPGLAHWCHWDEDRGLVPFDQRLSVQVERIVAGMETASDGRKLPLLGSRICNGTLPDPVSRSFGIRMRAGADHGHNQIIGGTDAPGTPDLTLFTFRVMKEIALAAAECFQATQARVYPVSLRDFWSDASGIGDDLDLAWISYVAPRFAGLVTPPASVFTERRPDGGLLMAATTETFSVENPDHLAAARAIKNALTAFNAVPWSEK